MGGSQRDPPESERLDEYAEVTVNGRTVFRMEQPSDAHLSDVDDAVIGFVLQSISEDIESHLQDEYEMSLEEMIEAHEPDAEMYDSDNDDWRSLFTQ